VTKMVDVPLLGTATQINELARTLVRYNCVAKFDRESEPEGGVLAHSFSDLEESFRTFLHELLPRLVAGNLSEEEVHGILILIGEEFRHIQYHIRDSRFYGYLQEEGSKFRGHNT